MDYEKKYKEAIEKAKKHYEECKMRGNDWFVEDMEDMFPELKENDKICKDCDYFLNNGKCTLDECPCKNDDGILKRV